MNKISKYNDFLLEKEFNSIINDFLRIVEDVEGKWTSPTTIEWDYSNEPKEEPEEDWRSPSNIRWIFTYRCDDDGTESFYQFPKMKELTQIPLLQPLTGLSPEAVDEVFSDFKVSEEFKQGVIKNSEIKNLALNE